MKKHLDIAIEAAREAGAFLKKNLGKIHSVEYKGEINLVTEIDRASEEIIVSILRN